MSRGLPAFASLPEITLLQSIGSNLAGLLVRLPKSPVDHSSAWMFRSAHLTGKPRGRCFATSLLLHTGVVLCLLNLPSLFPPAPPRRLSAAARLESTILYYRKADLLPVVSPPIPAKPKPRRIRRRQTPAATSAPSEVASVQVIISRPPKPDNQRQTIIQPEAPELRIQKPVEAPNIVQWQREYVPPRPEIAEVARQLGQITVPRLPAPRVAPPPLPEPPPLTAQNRSLVELSQVALAQPPKLPLPPPRPKELPPAPVLPNAAPSLGRQVIATMTETAIYPAPPPKELPPAPALARTAADLSRQAVPSMLTERTAPAYSRPTPVVPAPPVIVAGVNVRNLIAVGVAPAPAAQQFSVPEGNRAGEFAVNTDGKENKATAGEGKGARGKNSPPDLQGEELADLRVPHLSISGAKIADAVAPTVASPPQARPVPPAPAVIRGRDENLANLIAKATRPSLLPPRPLSDISHPQTPEREFFGIRHFYTLSLNMPNLTSASGSWVLHFAELRGGRADGAVSEDLSSPVAVRKVDPRYTPSAVREGVEGTVLLAAQILRDGSVSNVRIMHSVDPRLDESAAEALLGWEFLPAKKNGTAVDLEVLVQIPFRLPKY